MQQSARPGYKLVTMTLAEFQRSLMAETPPRDLAPPLAALWWASKDDWDKAHKIVMNEGGREAAWVHAYLHRLEGRRRQCGVLVPAGEARGGVGRARCGMAENRHRAARRDGMMRRG